MNHGGAAIVQYWNAFLATQPADSSAHYETYFGDSSALADELGDLIV